MATRSCTSDRNESTSPWCRDALINVGVFPIGDHYYEPQFNFRQLRRSPAHERSLPGVDLNVDGQLDFLKSFIYGHELAGIPREEPKPLDFYLDNPSFPSGDAEYWYQVVRHPMTASHHRDWQRLFNVDGYACHTEKSRR